MAKRRISDNTLVNLIIFFGLVSLFTGAKVLTQGEAPKQAA